MTQAAPRGRHDDDTSTPSRRARALGREGGRQTIWPRLGLRFFGRLRSWLNGETVSTQRCWTRFSTHEKLIVPGPKSERCWVSLNRRRNEKTPPSSPRRLTRPGARFGPSDLVRYCLRRRRVRGRVRSTGHDLVVGIPKGSRWRKCSPVSGSKPGSHEPSDPMR